MGVCMCENAGRLDHKEIQFCDHEDNVIFALAVERVNCVAVMLIRISSGYRISWEEFNRTNTRVTHYLPNVTLEYRVTGLTALTTYTIEVAGMTSKGQGLLSSSTISSGVPPGQTPNTPTSCPGYSLIQPRVFTAFQIT